MNYYIIPAKITYVKDAEGIDTEVIESIAPSIVSGAWIADCINGTDFVLKTDVLIDGLEPITEQAFDAVVASIGFDPDKVRQWSRGW